MGSGGFKKYAPSDIENLMFFWVNFKYFLLYKHALVRMCFWNKFGCPTAAWGSAPPDRFFLTKLSLWDQNKDILRDVRF